MSLLGKDLMMVGVLNAFVVPERLKQLEECGLIEFVTPGSGGFLVRIHGFDDAIGIFFERLEQKCRAIELLRGVGE